MSPARIGDTVKVHYTGRLQDGQVFDSSKERQPLQFTLGEEQVIQGFQDAVIGMTPGDSKTVTVESNNAYGPRREDLIAEVERNRIPEHIDPQVGQQLQINQPNGEAMVVTVTAVSESNVRLDGNHPLAGKDLVFDIELVEIG